MYSQGSVIVIMIVVVQFGVSEMEEETRSKAVENTNNNVSIAGWTIKRGQCN